MTNVSVQAQQREADRQLCERLRAQRQALPPMGGASAAVDAYGVLTRFTSYITDDGKRPVNPDGSSAASRIEQLAQDLAEALHDRDRYHAELERLREAQNGDTPQA